MCPFNFRSGCGLTIFFFGNPRHGVGVSSSFCHPWSGREACHRFANLLRAPGVGPPLLPRSAPLFELISPLSLLALFCAGRYSLSLGAGSRASRSFSACFSTFFWEFPLARRGAPPGRTFANEHLTTRLSSFFRMSNRGRLITEHSWSHLCTG